MYLKRNAASIVVALMLSAILLLAAFGCSAPTIGPTIVSDAEKVDSRSQRPTQTTWVKREPAALNAEGKPTETPASHTLNVAGNASNIVEIGKNGISQAGSGPAGQAILLEQPDGTAIHAFSQTNLKAAKRETIAPDGTRVVEVTFDSDSATATLADAERLRAALPIFQSLDAAQKEAALAQIRRDEAVWEAFFESLGTGWFEQVVAALGG
jgi:hypothetical protein